MSARAMTLIELVVVLAVLVALSGAVVALTDRVDEAVRWQESERRVQAVRAAITGAEAATGDGRLVFGGYLQDVGAFPASPAFLVARPAAVAPWDAGTRCGWRGPYAIPLPPRTSRGESGQCPVLYDDWGGDLAFVPVGGGTAASWAIGTASGATLAWQRPSAVIEAAAWRISLGAFTVRLDNRTGEDFGGAARLQARLVLRGPVDGALAELASVPAIAIDLAPGGMMDVAFPACPDLIAGRRQLALVEVATVASGASRTDLTGLADLPVSARVQPDDPLRLPLVKRSP